MEGPLIYRGACIFFLPSGTMSHTVLILQVTWRLGGRRIEFERRRSRGLRSTQSLNRDVSGKKAATNRKKRWPFSPPNKTNTFMFSFSGTVVEATWTNEKEKIFFGA